MSNDYTIKRLNDVRVAMGWGRHKIGTKEIMRVANTLKFPGQEIQVGGLKIKRTVKGLMIYPQCGLYFNLYGKERGGRKHGTS